MTIEGTSAVQEVPWATVNLLRPFFTPGLRPIMEGVLTAPAASVTFTNIPGNYRALFLMNQARSDSAAESDMMRGRFNADAGNNYDTMLWFGDGNNAQGSVGVIATSSIYVGVMEAANSRASNWSPSLLWLPGYALTDREKWSLGPISAFFGDISGVADMNIYQVAGRWRNTNAVTSLTLLPQNGTNFVSGSRFTLYGVL